MASAATLRASLPLLPVSGLESSPCDLARCGALRKCSRARELASKGVRYGANWGERHGLVRMARGEKDVVVENTEKEENEEEPMLLRMGVSLVTETLRLFSSLGR
jgi:hypothetical protein